MPSFLVPMTVADSLARHGYLAKAGTASDSVPPTVAGPPGYIACIPRPRPMLAARTACSTDVRDASTQNCRECSHQVGKRCSENRNPVALSPPCRAPVSRRNTGCIVARGGAGSWRTASNVCSGHPAGRAGLLWLPRCWRARSLSRHVGRRDAQQNSPVAKHPHAARLFYPSMLKGEMHARQRGGVLWIRADGVGACSH